MPTRRTTHHPASGLDDAAFADLYAAHGKVILRYLRRRLGEHAGEDAATAVFVKAFESRDRYRHEHTSTLPWLYGIASNVIADHRRAEKQRLRALARLAQTVEVRTSAHESREDQVSPELVAALRRLTAVDRETLLLVAWGELSYAETAEALAIPIGTVRSRIARARRHLDADLLPEPRAAERGPTRTPRETPNA